MSAEIVAGTRDIVPAHDGADEGRFASIIQSTPDTRSVVSLAAFASDCLLREILTYPKPGLVSHIDNGAHRDMDARMMCRSAITLEPYFTELVKAGKAAADFACLREIGVRAERTMLAVTNGTNTHRGAIFGMGLLCAAAEYRLRGDEYHGKTLGQIVKDRWGHALLHTMPLGQSNGALAVRRYGVLGARAQAADGFPAVYIHGLPAITEARAFGLGDEEAIRVHVLMRLVQAVDDTNLLHRGGTEGLMIARRDANAFIGRGSVGVPDWRNYAQRMHHHFISFNLSPGGCADLLAMTLFVSGTTCKTACRSQAL